MEKTYKSKIRIRNINKSRSVSQAIGDDALGNLHADALQNKLDENVGIGKTNITDFDNDGKWWK